jgi:hypothetical protein
MRITLKQLRKVIKEEIQRLTESTGGDSIASWKANAKASLQSGADEADIAQEWDDLITKANDLVDVAFAYDDEAFSTSLTQAEFFAFLVKNKDLDDKFREYPGVVQEIAQLILRGEEYQQYGEFMVKDLHREIDAHAAAGQNVKARNARLSAFLEKHGVADSGVDTTYADRVTPREGGAMIAHSRMVQNVQRYLDSGDEKGAEDYINKIYNRARGYR